MLVLVIGAGLGGLCLAHGLRRRGVDVEVFERDASADTRGQGHRIGLKEEGTDALRACLPADLYDLCAATALRTATRMVFTDEHLAPRFTRPIPQPGPGVFGVHRRTLREILLARLEPVIHFGHTFVGYRPGRDGGVVAHFGDGTSVAGDVLVGADGTGSAVRAQLVPDAVVDVLEETVYGRTPIMTTTLAEVPEVLVDTFNRVIAPDGAAIAVATCRMRDPGAARRIPDVRLTPVPDHFTWTLTVPDGASLPADPAALRDRARRAVADFHPAVRRIVADADTVFPLAITSARPVRPWDAAAVTLLGDAVHTMSPGRGDGANVALHDAQVLADALADAAAGRRPLAAALRGYQAEMLERGFAAVERSRTAPFGPRPGFRSAATSGSASEA